MEFVICAVLIAVLLFILGFELLDILYLAVGIALLFVVFIGGFFAFCLVLLAMSRRCKAVFVEIDDDPENSRFPCAVYEIDGKRVRNMFPCEMIARKKLYVPEKKIRIFYCKPRNEAIDKNAYLTIVFGSLIFIPAAVFSVLLIIRFISAV